MEWNKKSEMYELPVAEVILFENEDVITSSNELVPVPGLDV